MNLPSTLFKIIHWPICRAYGRYIMKDKPADTVMRFLCSFQYWRVYKFWPNFIKPQRFSEKLWSRMLHARDPLLTLISDKLRVRDYVERKVGQEFLVPLLWKAESPEEIPFAEFPSKFVIKTNHGCGYNIIVKDKKQLDQKKVKRQLKKWLGENFCQDKFLGIEWGYKNIRPTIIIESFIDENGEPPVDYKFYCFSGRVEILTLHFDRFGKHRTKAFNRSFEPFEFKHNFDQWIGEYPHPSTFEKMVQLAETLAEGFDFIRVDLYSVDNKVYFGELTPYPAGISSFRGLDLTSLDCVLGEKWK